MFFMALAIPAAPFAFSQQPSAMLLPSPLPPPPLYPAPPPPPPPAESLPQPSSSKRGLVLFSSVIVSCIGAAIIAVLVVWCYLERRRYGAVGRLRLTHFRHPRIPQVPTEPRQVPQEPTEVSVTIPTSPVESPKSVEEKDKYKARCSITRHATHS